jgi:hypothetical protein
MPFDEVKISQAINRCLDVCRHKKPKEVFPVIKNVLKSLTSGGGWTTTELRCFEREVYRALIFGPSQGGILAGSTARPSDSRPPVLPETGSTAA